MNVSLSDILSTAGNQQAYNRLKELLQANSAIAFIGAGASFPLYPLWPQLIRKLANEPVRQGLATAADEQYWLNSAASKPLQVASQIRAKLGDPHYHTFLFETFKDQANHTPAQGALMRANFKAYITTNYDGGIVEARRRLRPEIADTGFTLWNQNYPVNRWASGDVFGDTHCPVLFAHGHHADPASIVLDHSSYRIAYHDTPYRRCFENLWIQQHLVFAGFSFDDITLAQITDEVLWQTTRQGGGAPRHIAILGLPVEQPYSDQMRREFLDGYHAQALFYPVGMTADGHPDHSALQTLLDSLSAPPVTVVATPAPKLPDAAPARFVHESTEDEKFTGRTEILARLDRWAADPAVRLIAITAIGGLGKTALAGRWLRHNIVSEARFFWSFYRERKPAKLFEALAAFGAEELGCAKPALELLASRRIVVVLDGLEVIQEIPGTVAYGELLSIELAAFLHAHCRAKNSSLVVLTSRFPFPDLTPYLGSSLRSLALPSLEPAEGSALLASLGIGGQSEDREEIVRNLSGHPLALRIFARTLPPASLGDPTRLVHDAQLAAGDSLDDKMQRLLAFYEARLPESQKKALGLLAFFRIPVGEATLAPLWEKLLGKRDDNLLRNALYELHREGLLTDDPGEDGKPRYACHPILRDHFRTQFAEQPAFAREAASLIAGPPDAQKTRSLEAVQIIATAIEVLLDAGEVEAADDLYKSRLEDGELFKWLPAPHWGMQVARGFLSDQARRQAIVQRISTKRLSYYLNEVAIFAKNAGEPEIALEFYAEAIPLYRKEKDDLDLGTCLLTLGHIEISLGHLAEAASRFAEAFELVSKDERKKQNVVTSIAYVATLRGGIDRADTCFAEANAIGTQIDSVGVDLYGLRGILWAEHLIRIGSGKRARQLTEANRKICESNSWQEDIAKCEWILGWLDTLASDWPNAHTQLIRAKATFTAGHMIYELARVFVTEAACHLGQNQWDLALAACERALQLAAPRRYRLIHADAMNLRARIALDRRNPDPTDARDDAEAALQLANFCDYHWGQLDARALLDRAKSAKA